MFYLRRTAKFKSKNTDFVFSNVYSLTLNRFHIQILSSWNTKAILHYKCHEIKQVCDSQAETSEFIQQRVHNLIIHASQLCLRPKLSHIQNLPRRHSKISSEILFKQSNSCCGQQQLDRTAAISLVC
jgi:hypothetical protein